MSSPVRESRAEIREYYGTVGRFIELEFQRRKDSAYWRRRASERHRPRVLELGAGTGRITRLLAPLAGRVVAIDLSLEMLLRARRNLHPLASHLHLVLSDMREFGFAECFDLIVAANDPFAHLPTDGERDRVLRRVAHHLDEGGVFVLDALWLPPGAREQVQCAGEWSRRRSLDGGGEDLSVAERWTPAPGEGRMRVEYEYRKGARTVGRASFQPRLWSPGEVERRFPAAGLRVRRLLGGYDERPWNPSDASVLIAEGELDPSAPAPTGPPSPPRPHRPGRVPSGSTLPRREP